jgi:tetratricopeptide (TPR) repeat protein
MMGKNHVERELLLRYAMSEVPIVGVREENKLALEDARYIERHLLECPACQQEVELFKDAVEAGDELLANVVEKHFHGQDVRVVTPKKFPIKTAGWIAAPALVVVALLFLASASMRSLINPPLRVQASVENELPSSINEFVKGLDTMADGAAHFLDGDYAGAVACFREASISAEEDSKRGLAHLNMGLSFLAMAERRELGLFYEFDRELADSALAHLDACLELTKPFPFFQEAALYFSAKAHLMRNDPAAARTSLEAGKAIRGPKHQAVVELLRELPAGSL